LSKDLKKQHGTDVLTIQLDIQNNEEVINAINSLEKKWSSIDILLNNAGVALSTDLIQEGNLDNWDIMINTNFRGLLYVTRSILPGMISRNRGHIINIGSCAGHDYFPRGNVYCATKHAVKAISKSLRIDLLGIPIRVTEIDPGSVQTEFSEVRWRDKERAKEFYSGFTPLVADDIADAVVYCATRPLHVDISELVIFPTEQASSNHLYRKNQKPEGLFERKN
jgi:3-hydroxy acid dehydrogenase / malonic semialdehyde reductase